MVDIVRAKQNFNTLTINIDSVLNNPTSNASLRFDWKGNGGIFMEIGRNVIGTHS